MGLGPQAAALVAAHAEDVAAEPVANRAVTGY